jgi:hypothetical protein
VVVVEMRGERGSEEAEVVTEDEEEPWGGAAHFVGGCDSVVLLPPVRSGSSLLVYSIIKPSFFLALGSNEIFCSILNQ